MDEAVPFDDVSPDEKIEFLDAARERHPGPSPAWICDACGVGYSIDQVLVVDNQPRCPSCGALGWEAVHPDAAAGH